MFHCLQENEDPHNISFNKVDIWVQVYDLPNGFISDKILKSIGNYIGGFVKADPANMNGMWKLYVRIRVTIDVNATLKRKIKIKRAGGDWSWVSFKYERLSTFCFVCGMLGHSERVSGIVYANLDKVIDRAYGTWLRAPNKNMRTQNVGAKWLRSGNGDDHAWGTPENKMNSSQAAHGGDSGEVTRFMEVDGIVREISGGFCWLD